MPSFTARPQACTSAPLTTIGTTTARSILPTGAVIVDSVGNKDNGALDQTYGPAANVINSQLHPNLFVADGISRIRGNTARNNATAGSAAI